MVLLGFWEKVYLSLCNNGKEAWFYRYRMLCSVLASTFFVLILVAIRNSNKVQHMEMAFNEPVNLTAQWIKFTQRISDIHDKLAKQGVYMHNPFVPQLIVGYAPDISIFSNLMMNASVEYLDNITLVGFETEKALRIAMEKEHFLAGVSFYIDRNGITDTKLKNFYELNLSDELFNLAYSLIFPSELRFFADSFIGQSWRTNRLYISYSELQRNNSVENTNYVREGFVSLQNAVSLSYIKKIGQMVRAPEILVSQFPRISHVFDPMLSHLAFILPFLITMGHMCLLLSFSMRIVTQKLYKRKKLHFILGINRRVHTLTWIILGNAWLLLPAILVLFSIKIGVVDGFAVCSQSSWSALFFFLLCYNLSSVCFCFMTSSLTRSVPNAMILFSFSWIIAFLPYMTSESEFPRSVGKQILSALCANTVFGYGFNKIIDFERSEEGLQWRNFFEYFKYDRISSVGVHCILFVFLSMLYTILGLFLYKLPILLIIIKKKLSAHRVQQVVNIRPSSGNLSTRKTLVLEIQNENKKVLLELKNLTKEYNDKKAINNLSLNIYESEVTVVMGHNGSGKTTLLEMIGGVIHPTSGSVKLDGFSLTFVFDFGLSIGVGVQEMLHPELTVADQIILYSRLRGYDMNEAQEEVEKYTRAMDMKDVTNVFTYKLNNCLKRCLTVCCTFCGDSKLVILDDPTTGMDLVHKIKIWDLIISEKINRTIIISTHSAEEAEVLGDHLLVLSGGELMCYGSMFFMKSMYGKGNRLLCYKTPYCQTTTVTSFLRNYIPHISPESDIGRELCYRLNERHSSVFPKLLADLEEEFDKLEISGCTISETIVEDIVLRMGSEDATENDNFRQSDIFQGYTAYPEENKTYTFTQDFKPYKGLLLFITHLRAMFLKKFYSNSHTEKALLYICLPASVTLFTFIISDPTFDRLPLEPMTFRMTQYAESVTPISVNMLNVDQKSYNLFLEYFNNLPSLSVIHKLDIISAQNFSEYLLEKQSSQKTFNEKYLVGVSFENLKLIAWFNNYWLHTAPLSLNLLHNGFLAILHHSGTISVTHDPLPLRAREDLPDLRTMAHIGHALAFILSYLICFIYSYALFYSIKEHTMHLKLAQFIFGIRYVEFFLGQFLYDLMKISVISLSVLIITLCYRQNIPGQNRAAAFCLLIMIIFGICIMPYYYLVSLIFKNAGFGYWLVCFHNVLGVSCFIALLETIDSHDIEELEMSTLLKVLSYLLPHFILCKALIKVFSIGKARFICQNEDIRITSILLDGCNTAPNCCYEPEELEWTNWGILPEIKYFFILGTISTILLYICELRNIWKRLIDHNIPKDNLDLSFEDYKRSHDESYKYQIDIIKERVRVEQLKRNNLPNKPLVMSNVSKLFGKKVAVNRVSLAMDRGECFGLLGANDSGKTTVLRLLVGDINLSCGRAYVHGISVLDDIDGIYKIIGYCPNHHSFPGNMTCYQILEFFCQLRGTPTALINEISLSLAKCFGLMKNLNKQTSETSPGIKRRLATAITFIGKPNLVLLDDVSVGLDPAIERQTRRVIHSLLSYDTAVFLTENSPSVAERFCTRIGIINKGHLLCIDDVHKLQRRHAKVYKLRMKLKFTTKTDDSSMSTYSLRRFSISNQVSRMQAYMEYMFPDAVILYQHGHCLVYAIPSTNTSLSQIFKKLRRKTETFYIDRYSVLWVTIPLLMAELLAKESIDISKLMGD